MSGIYIHIPFCKQACNYCNFHFSTSLKNKDALVWALVKEIELQAKEYRHTITTIYFGGGTPSLLTVNEIDRILQSVNANFKIDDDPEITIEANPDDIDIQKLQGWKQAGINRLSIGIQSFFNEDLIWMNRAHNAQQSTICLNEALRLFNNITIDLIYGVPGLTDERWYKNVQTAFGLGIPHISCYALTVEPQTPLAKLVKAKKVVDVDGAQQSGQFLLLMEWMEAAGYEHYEISNFAKHGFRSRHNTSYWQGKPYIGIGPAAHSYDGTCRTWNIANNQKYMDAINHNIIPAEAERLTPLQKLNEYIMLSIRTNDGLDLKKLMPEQAKTVLQGAAKYINDNKMIVTDNKLMLTRQGKLFADGIAADLFFE